MTRTLSFFLAMQVMCCAAHAADRAPNVLLIFADDLGWTDVGYQGDGYLETPRIDRLAKEGMVFTNAYASAGNCAPSRACLLSGSYTPRHHVFAVQSTNRGPKDLMRLKPVPNKSGLRSEVVTMADALRGAGYATGIFGKWHLSGADGAYPSDQGFDVVYKTFGEGEIPESARNLNRSGPPDDAKGVYSLTQKALEFMEANRDQPFFCYLSHHAVHSPWAGRREVLKKFKAKNQSASRTPIYAACTHALDDSIAVLLEKLEELDLAKDTLVVFVSDNGGADGMSQEPLRGNKGGYYEGGVRVPMIVRWPGRITPGSTCTTPVINVDLYPTFLSLAGGKPAAGAALDGESLLPLFEQTGPLNREAIFWHFPGYLDRPVKRGRDPVFRTRPVTVIRKGDWKLHLYHEEWILDGGRDSLATNSAVELYNVTSDIGERVNLANEQTEVRDELLDDLLAWIDATGAPLATLRTEKDQSHAQ